MILRSVDHGIERVGIQGQNYTTLLCQAVVQLRQTGYIGGICLFLKNLLEGTDGGSGRLINVQSYPKAIVNARKNYRASRYTSQNVACYDTLLLI
jgi:hypothetical protein